MEPTKKDIKKDKKANLPPVDHNYLSSWSDVIQKQGEERAAKEEATLQKMKDGFDAQVLKMKEMNNKDLLDHFQAYSQRGCADPRQTEIYQNMAIEAKELILMRMY